MHYTTSSSKRQRQGMEILEGTLLRCRIVVLTKHQKVSKYTKARQCHNLAIISLSHCRALNNIYH